MSGSGDHLYDLLPRVYRARDEERGGPLRALLGVIQEQVDVVENDIARLYDNWFIETCDDWVVPYIGELIGYSVAPEAGDPVTGGAGKNAALFPRREVAATLGYRRRKGTLGVLESLAQAAGWPAHAVEFYQHLLWMQHVDHLRLSRGRIFDVRDSGAIARVDGPFDRAAHSIDVRRASSPRTRGKYNIPSVGVFVWRLKPYSVTGTQAYCLESLNPQFFTFSALGNDAPLYNRIVEDSPTHPRDLTVPATIGRRAFERRISHHPVASHASELYYGSGRSLSIHAPDWPAKGAAQPVPRDLVIPADLSGWRYRVPRGHVGVDPVLGRMVFGGTSPKKGVTVDYHYGFSADMGGGEYRRRLSQPALCKAYRVSASSEEKEVSSSIGAALTRWRADVAALGDEPPNEPEKSAWREQHEPLRAAVVEIEDSAVYTERLSISLKAGEYLQIRAASGRRPILRLLDNEPSQPDGLALAGERGSRLKLDGLIVTGRGIMVLGPEVDDERKEPDPDLCDVTIRHCTLVPGWGLKNDCDPAQPSEPSIALNNTSASLRIEHSIVGAIHVSASETASDPITISIADSVVDATSVTRAAIGGLRLPLAFARLSVTRTTIIGQVNVHAIDLAENTIFDGVATVGRRQIGCVRYSYVESGSRTPRRYRCQPDTALAGIDGDATAEVQAREREHVIGRVRPCFTSTRYGTPGYCQLTVNCADEIVRGADDESELGAFHDLYQPQRMANLRARLEEYTPDTVDVALIVAS